MNEEVPKENDTLDELPGGFMSRNEELLPPNTEVPGFPRVGGASAASEVLAVAAGVAESGAVAAVPKGGAPLEPNAGTLSIPVEADGAMNTSALAGGARSTVGSLLPSSTAFVPFVSSPGASVS